MSAGSVSQNPVGFAERSWKSGLMRAFSNKFRAAFPKAGVLGKPARGKTRKTCFQAASCGKSAP
jgi:hypothetical protein